MRLLASLAFGLLVVPPALASPIHSDDFESGLLAPAPGKWGSAEVGTGCSGCSIGAGTTSAHRGTYGMFFQDTDGGSGGGVQGRALKSVSSALTNIYGRFWFRTTQNNGLGQAIVAQVVSTGAGDLAIMDLSFNPGIGGGNFTIAGRDAIGTYLDDDAAFRPTLGSWYLVEFEVKGIGNHNSLLRGYIDGSLKVQVPLDLSDATASYITLGEPYTSDERFSGTFNFDDYRTDTAPMASKWALGAPSAAPGPGGCMPVTATLVDSINGTPAAAPYALVATVSHTGAAGTFFSDAQCTTPATSLAVAAGAQGGTVYFRPEAPGTAALAIDHIDFLPASRSVLIPDAPAPGTDLDAGTPVAVAASGITPSEQALPDCPTENPLCQGELSVGSSCGAGPTMVDGGFTLTVIAGLLLSVRRARRVGMSGC